MSYTLLENENLFQSKSMLLKTAWSYQEEAVVYKTTENHVILTIQEGSILPDEAERIGDNLRWNDWKNTVSLYPI